MKQKSERKAAVAAEEEAYRQQMMDKPGFEIGKCRWRIFSLRFSLSNPRQVCLRRQDRADERAQTPHETAGTVAEIKKPGQANF